MSTKIYVGNLPYSVTDSSLRSNFAEFGAVTSAKVMMDRETGRSKGFAFVKMTSADECQAAISGLHGMSVDGRSMLSILRSLVKKVVGSVATANSVPALVQMLAMASMAMGAGDLVA